ncbi:MAG TPA: hypothetical protein VLM37_13310 [Fibrobacteraceae bacterium]|nr:hypothetical protein [Fibrobacteraceae bacterium]
MKVKGGWILCSLFLWGCAPGIKRIDYAPEAPQADSTIPVSIIKGTTHVAGGLTCVGTTKIYDKGFSFFCGQDEVEKKLREEAHRQGANLVVIQEETQPSFLGSSCYQVTAGLYRIDRSNRDTWISPKMALRIAYDSIHQLYKATKESSAASKNLQDWEVLRDGSGNIVRKHFSADSLQWMVYVAIQNKDTVSMMQTPAPDVPSLMRSRAFNHYLNGVSLYRAQQSPKARAAFHKALQLDTLLAYYSDVNLWIAHTFDAKEFPDSVTVYRNQFRNKSQSLCPASSNINHCQDSLDYARLLRDTGAFQPYAMGNNLRLASFTQTPIIARTYYGMTDPNFGRHWDILWFGLDFSADGIGYSPSVSYIAGNRFRASLLFHKSWNYMFWGGAATYQLYSDSYNRKNLKAKSYMIHYDVDDGDDKYSFNQPMLGWEASYAVNPRWLLFMSGMGYFYSQWNHLQIGNGEGIREIWMKDFINIGSTFFFADHIGLTLRNIFRQTEVGFQLGGVFFGYDINAKSVMLTTIFWEDLILF